MRSRLRTLTLLLAASACAAHPPAPDPVGPAFEERLYALGALHVRLKIPNAPPGRKPAIVSSFGAPEPLLARGLILVDFQVDWAFAAKQSGTPLPPPEPEPPAPHPASQVGAWLLASPRPGIIGRSYFQLIGASAAQNVPAVVDLLERLPEVDPQRIAIAGSSTQGFVALEALRSEPRLAAGVVRVACGDYLTFLRSSSLALNDEARWLPRGRLQLDPDYEAELRTRQPIDAAHAFPPRPLLMLAGREDRPMPFACVQNTADAFARAYAQAGVPERFELRAFSGEGHHLGPPSEALALQWWERWLFGAVPE
jgi:hypothetical protein